MKIRYSKPFAIGSIVLGIVLACLAFLPPILGSRNASGSIVFVAGFFSILQGVFYLTRPYFTVNDTRLDLYNAFLGTVMGSYTFRSLKDIELSNNQLFLNQDGRRRKIQISKWMVDRSDWEQLVQKLRS